MLLLNGNKAFNDIAAAMYDKEDEILNYFIHRSTNAAAESLNAKIKQFRAQLRGIIDRKFFLLGSLEFMRSHTLLQVIRFFFSSSLFKNISPAIESEEYVPVHQVLPPLLPNSLQIGK